MRSFVPSLANVERCKRSSVASRTPVRRASTAWHYGRGRELVGVNRSLRRELGNSGATRSPGRTQPRFNEIGGMVSCSDSVNSVSRGPTMVSGSMGLLSWNDMAPVLSMKWPLAVETFGLRSLSWKTKHLRPKIPSATELPRFLFAPTHLEDARARRV